jgi:hypothetical protein
MQASTRRRTRTPPTITGVSAKRGKPKSGRGLPETAATKEAVRTGRGFEAAIEAGVVPPPGYLWVNKFLAGAPSEWLPGLPHAAATLKDRLDTAGWLTRLANQVKAREGLGGTAAEVTLFWSSYTTGLAGITFSAAHEFLDEQAELAGRVDALIAEEPARAATKPWLPDTDLRTTVLAEAVREGLRSKEAVFKRGKFLGGQGEAEWDANLPSKTLGAFWMLLEQECNNYLQMPAYGLFDPKADASTGE